MHMIYGYIRVSGKGQVEKDGPERQREVIEAFCSTNQMQIMGVFFEKAVSGMVEGVDRPTFADMLDRVACMAKNGIIVEAIVVERMDRLARDLMVSELLLAECRRLNIKVFSADQGMLIDMATNGGDPTRVLIRQIMGALAQWDKSITVHKLRVARERMKAKTGRCEGIKPYGTFTGEQATLTYLEAIASATPRPTYRAMANSLNCAGLKNRKGNRWLAPQVYDLVHRKARQSAAE